MKTYIFILFLLSASLVSGCAGVVVGGAATGVAVAHDRRSTGTFIDDQDLKWKLSQAIYADKGISDEAHINITVYNGAVLLSGEAPSEDLKLRANAIAARTKKVVRVFNEITIESPSSVVSRSHDSYVTGKVKIALLDTPEDQLDLTHVKVVTENGTVFLMGMVTEKEATVATNLSRTVGGVKKIIKLFEYIPEQPQGTSGN